MLSKSLQQAFNPEIAGSFRFLRLKLKVPVNHNIIVHIGQVLMLPGAISPEVLHNITLRITLTVPEVVDTGNWVTSNLPFRYSVTAIINNFDLVCVDWQINWQIWQLNVQLRL